MSRCYKPFATKIIAATAGLALLPAVALAELAQGDHVGTTETEITAQLVKQGYKIKEIEREDGELEVEVTLNGKDFEIEIDPKTGKIIEIEQDD